MLLKTLITAAIALMMCPAPSEAQDAAVARTYLVKLSVPVSTTASKAGDRIRAAIISPESLLNGYLEGVVQHVSSKPAGRLVLHFTGVLYKGRPTAIEGKVIDFVNSKGHKSVDDDERPITLDEGRFASARGELWLDEGAELRVQAIPVPK
jgi:hypothetical protein